MTRDEIMHQLDRMLFTYEEAVEAGLTDLPELGMTTANFMDYVWTEFDNYRIDNPEVQANCLDKQKWLDKTVDAWDNALGGFA